MFKTLENAYEYAPLPLRLGLAAMFAYTGITKVMDPAGKAQMFASLGFPLPEITVWVVAAVEIIGALLLLLGLLTRVAAIALTVLLAVAIVTAYIIPWNPDNLMMLMLHWPLIGATLSLVLYGPGKLSLDERLYWE
jgi:putative oxidoreductase